jgi:hypothetical protein
MPIKKPKTVSTRRTHSNRPRSDDAILHGINSAQKTARPVPTQFARNEFEISPRTKSAKLVVIPHDGTAPHHSLGARHIQASDAMPTARRAGVMQHRRDEEHASRRRS